jgi:hypothetical protein
MKWLIFVVFFFLIFDLGASLQCYSCIDGDENNPCDMANHTSVSLELVFTFIFESVVEEDFIQAGSYKIVEQILRNILVYWVRYFSIIFTRRSKIEKIFKFLVYSVILSYSEQHSKKFFEKNC